MKTTIDMQDGLLSRAKQHARQTGRPLRAVVEEGLRMVLETPLQSGYSLPDLSVGDLARRDLLGVVFVAPFAVNYLRRNQTQLIDVGFQSSDDKRQKCRTLCYDGIT